VLFLVIALVATNLLSLGVLVRFLLKPTPQPEPDDVVQKYLAERRPAVSSSGTRRVITIEILNPLELAGKRGWWAGIAGSLVPGITRRIVHDQALRMVRRQLAHERVVADVRLCVLHPDSAQPPVEVAAPVQPVDLVKHRPQRPA
jgi:hypothetical protein